MTTYSYWAVPAQVAVGNLNSSTNGLAQADARRVLERVGPTRIHRKEQVTPLGLFLNQFKNPIVLILVSATVLSAFLKDWVDATIILLIVVGSALLSLFQEYRASNAAQALQAQVSLKTKVLRDGKPEAVPTDDVVPGDVVLPSAGSLVPADGLVLEATNFFVNQAVLTGETFPTEKRPGVVGEGGETYMITKGALDIVLAVCSRVRSAQGETALSADRVSRISERFEGWSTQGYRVLGVAVKQVTARDHPYVPDDENEMTFVGFFLFLDPPKRKG